MQNVVGVWLGLEPRRRVIVILAVVTMFAAVLMVSKLAGSRSMDLLYAGLDGAAAGEVVASLEQKGIAYEVRGGSIYVEDAARDRLRMVLASEGLPNNGPAGYELLDGLSGFGTTSQMFDAAYWRAKEGELARTIMASPNVEAARVHIANPGWNGFRRDREAAASVFVTPAGGGLTEAQGKAFRFLVASAVWGLSPENVSVIDGETGAVLGAADGAPTVAADQRAEQLKANVTRLVEAHVGPGNAIVEVSLDPVTERESIVERRFDPEGRVAISTETEERSNTSRGQAGAAVTVASNLPDGDAARGPNDSSSQNSETRERVNFEVSETQREVLRVPGAVKRLTVAVLVNGVPGTDASGAEAIVPRPESEIAPLRELIAAAVGYDEARGDQITIRSMPFEPRGIVGSGPEVSLVDRLDLQRLAQIGVLAAVALAIGLFVLRPILTRRPAGPRLELAPPPGAATEGGQRPAAQVLTGEIADDDDTTALPAMPARGEGRARVAGPGAAEDPVLRLRQLIKERQHDTVEVLRSWMEEDKEKV